MRPQHPLPQDGRIRHPRLGSRFALPPCHSRLRPGIPPTVYPFAVGSNDFTHLLFPWLRSSFPLVPYRQPCYGHCVGMHTPGLCPGKRTRSTGITLFPSRRARLKRFAKQRSDFPASVIPNLIGNPPVIILSLSLKLRLKNWIPLGGFPLSRERQDVE